MLFTKFSNRIKRLLRDEELIIDRLDALVSNYEELVEMQREVLAAFQSNQAMFEVLLMAKVKESEAIRKVADKKLEREIAETPSEYDKRF